jgi:hypothetical protein
MKYCWDGLPARRVLRRMTGGPAGGRRAASHNPFRGAGEKEVSARYPAPTSNTTPLALTGYGDRVHDPCHARGSLGDHLGRCALLARTDLTGQIHHATAGLYAD